MTKNMSDFISKNALNMVVSAGHVNSKGLHIDKVSESVGIEYRFTDGSKLILTRQDVLSAPSFNPTWDL